MKLNKLFFSILATCAISTAPILLDNVAGTRINTASADDSQQSTRKSRKVAAMRERVYGQLARAQKVSDEQGVTAGLEILNEVKQRVNQLNSYERAMLWNFYGFMYYSGDDIDNAALHFEKVVAEQAIPESLYLSTLYSLAQLKTQQQEFDSALSFLRQWQQANVKPLKPQEHILFAQIYYQNKQYQQTLASVNQAVAIAESNNQVPKENWLILQRAAFYELKQPQGVVKVIEKLVKFYEKPEYWVQLAGMYGEIGQEQKQLGAMEAAYQAGYITKSSDIISLAQLYMFHKVPYKAAKLLDETMAKGTIVASVKHLELLAQAYTSAKEEQKAIPVLVKASEIAEHGKFDERLAQTYLNTEQWQKAIVSAQKALERGGLEQAGNMHLVIGMAEFNRKNFEQSLQAFNKAAQLKATKKMAQQWYKYVEREQSHMARLAMVR